jgi:hypothetical protein
MSKQATRSPIKLKLLRHPGQSLDEEIERVIDEKVMNHAIVIILAGVFIFMEWLRWLFQSPPQPVLVTVVCAAAILYSAYRIRQARPLIRALKLGREGERAVAEYLERLKRSGYRIFHDVVADGFNIDHVIISTRGVFAVETKTYSKPAQGESVVQVEGDRVFVNGREPDRNPIKQAEALARWLREMLQESTSQDYFVRSIVLYPGWFVKGRPANKRVWVLNPKMLEAWFKHEPETLAESDVSLAAKHLSSHIRAN